MLGFDDGWIVLVYVLCILSTLICVGYGLMNWNRGLRDEEKQVEEQLDWEKKDLGIDNGK